MYTISDWVFAILATTIYGLFIFTIYSKLYDKVEKQNRIKNKYLKVLVYYAIGWGLGNLAYYSLNHMIIVLH